MKKPRPYQAECIEMLDLARKIEMDKALIVMASGLGKTLTSAFDIADYLNESEERRRVLFLCHNNEILDGAKREYKSIFGDEFSYGLFSGIEKTAHKVDFLFASFQTMKHWLKTFDKHEFDYIVVDEAHHAQARSYKRVIKYFKPKFLLGMTATPKRLDGLDISELFGETVYEKDLPAAIRDGLLSDVDYRLLLDDIEKIFEYLDRDDVTIAELNRNVFIPKRDEEIVRIINEKLAERENPKTIVFCPSINYANIMMEMLDGAVAVHSEIPQQECLQRILDFRHGKVPTIVSVDQLNEGVDIPDADVIVFLRSTVSPVVFYQQLGRGLRKVPGKKSVLVLDFVANCERIEMIENLRIAVAEAAHTGRSRKRNEGLRLNIATPKFRESYRDIVESIERARSKDRHNYTDEDLLDYLRDLYTKLGRTPVSSDIKSDPNGPSTYAFWVHFGGVPNAVQLAGIPAYEPGYSREYLLGFVKQLGKMLGRAPLIGELKLIPNAPTPKTYRESIGPWDEVLVMAGFEPPKKEWTRDELIQVLRDICARNGGRCPTHKDVMEAEDAPSIDTFENEFGGNFGMALIAAGFTSGKGIRFANNGKHSYGREKLLQFLRDKAKSLGRTPSQKDVDDDPNMPSLSAYKKNFGTYGNAVTAAGLKFEENHGDYYTDEQLAKDFRDKTISLGRIPSKKEVDDDPNMAGSTTYRSHFGPWKNIIKAAGVENYRQRKKAHELKFTKEELLDGLCEFYRKNGRWPLTKDMNSKNELHTCDTYIKYFGSSSAAIDAAKQYLGNKEE